RARPSAATQLAGLHRRAGARRRGRPLMSKSAPRSRLYTPRISRLSAPRLDADAVGKFTESIARFFGTGSYLLIQTIIVVVWILLNAFAVSLRWDPYPFILLNLAFSTQAAYAAPLILLAQNRQENRDRVTLEEDRRRAQETKADTEYLARELAALRLAIGEGARIRAHLRRELEDLRVLLEGRHVGEVQSAHKDTDGDVDRRAASSN